MLKSKFSTPDSTAHWISSSCAPVSSGLLRSTKSFLAYSNWALKSVDLSAVSFTNSSNAAMFVFNCSSVILFIYLIILSDLCRI